MSNNGWIKIHRKIIDNCIYKDSELLHLFIHCLLKANHKESRFIFNGQQIKVKRGQFISGRIEISRETKIKPSTVYRKLKILVNLEILNIESNNKFSLITVVNYNTYQDMITTSEQLIEQQMNNSGISTEQQANTNKNKKNEKNEEKQIEFDRFWDTYDKKRGNKDKIFKLFNKLSIEDRKLIFRTLPDYVSSTPDKKYRKDPQTYLIKESWKDEIISSNGSYKPKTDIEPENC